MNRFLTAFVYRVALARLVCRVALARLVCRVAIARLVRRVALARLVCRVAIARLVLSIGCGLPLTSAAQCVIEQATAPLLELYTSEGCSSCPPADTWLSRWDPERAIPVAFHVDYWDSLGWPDRFGSEQNSARQSRLARSAKAGVYTPGFFINGAEWRGFFRAQMPDTSTLSLAPETQRLGVKAEIVSNRLTLSSESSGLWFAITESNLKSKVARGENAGRNLQHDHVVRHWAELPAKHMLQLDKDLSLQRAHLVIWRERDGRPSAAARVALSRCASSK
jgi:hypothetical protein